MVSVAGYSSLQAGAGEARGASEPVGEDGNPDVDTAFLATSGSIEPVTAEPLPIPSEGEPSVEELLAAVHEIESASPAARAAVLRSLAARPSGAGRMHLVGRARKVSVSMPENLMAAVQQRVGRGDFSQYVSEAVARQLELDLLGELAALLEAEHGQVPDEALAEARRSWPDGQ